MAAEAAIAHDRAVEASNMKSAFLANVSHEVRTGLRPGLPGPRARLGRVPPRRRRCLTVISQAGAR